MPERFLIIKLSSIGDVLMASPMVRALRQAKPDAYIAWVVEPKSADVVVGNPYIDEAIVWRKPSRKGLVSAAAGVRRLVGDLRGRRFDAVFDAQGLLKSAAVAYASGAKLRVGFSDSREHSHVLYSHRCVSSQSRSAQQRCLDLLSAVGVESSDTAMTMPLLEGDRAFAEKFYRSHGLGGRTVVAMIPATTWPNKHWRPEAWAQLADILAERFGAVGVILGSKADARLADEIIGRSRSKPVSAAGETTIKTAAALIERAHVGIGVDTGLLHASVALKKPTIAIFGPSLWRNFARQDDYVWLTKEMPCSPCCRHPSCEGYPCIWGITPEEAADAASPYLG